MDTDRTTPYFVFSSPNNSTEITSHGMFYGPEAVKDFFFEYFFPKDVKDPSVMSLYGYCSYHLEMLKKSVDPHEGLQMSGKNNITFLITKYMGEFDYGDSVMVLVAKKKISEEEYGELLWTTIDVESDGEEAEKAWKEEGYTVCLEYRRFDRYSG